MPAPVALKKAARSLGLYQPARRLYRALSPDVRHQHVADAGLYGQFIRPGDLVFDIGANLGQKSEIFLELGARVVALEPNPNCAAALNALHGDLTLVQSAVGSHPGSAQLNFANTISTASLREDWHGLNWRDGQLQKVTVPVTTLDRLIERYGVPDFCKVDVEGFEVEVIRGLNQPVKLISFEYHADCPDEPQACVFLLSSLAPIEVNVIAMNAADFVQPTWMTPAEFQDWVVQPGIPQVGDVFVRAV